MHLYIIFTVTAHIYTVTVAFTFIILHFFLSFTSLSHFGAFVCGVCRQSFSFATAKRTKHKLERVLKWRRERDACDKGGNRGRNTDIHVGISLINHGCNACADSHSSRFRNPCLAFCLNHHLHCFCSCFHLQLDWGCLGWRQLQSCRQCLLICLRPRPRHSLLHGPPLLRPKSLPLIKPNPKSSSIIEV